jgi:autotransporter translocation and assembly factor TamB
MVEWKPVVAWDVRARGEALDPSMWSRHLDRMHGSVRLSGRSSGRVEAGASEFTLVMDSLTGDLDSSPVRGYASVAIRDGDVEIDSSWIDWHGISAYAYGRYADSVHLVWEASVPDLSLLCDSCAGSVQAQGEAYGPREALAVNAEIGGSSVVFREYRAKAAEGRLS